MKSLFICHQDAELADYYPRLEIIVQFIWQFSSIIAYRNDTQTKVWNATAATCSTVTLKFPFDFLFMTCTALLWQKEATGKSPKSEKVMFLD